MSNLKYKVGDKCKLNFRPFLGYNHPCGLKDGSIVTLRKPNGENYGWLVNEFPTVGYYFLEEWLIPLEKTKSGFGKWIVSTERSIGSRET